METISQRELRNDNAAIMRRLVEGESFVITRSGIPVGRLIPDTGTSDLRCTHPAKVRPVYAERKRIQSPQDTQAVLTDLREGR